MRHKVGDKVKIKGPWWYEYSSDQDGYIVTDMTFGFEPGMAEYCGKEATVTSKSLAGESYTLSIDKGAFVWQDWMLDKQIPFNEPERGIVSTETGDNVNHPSHYTAGSIECIDAITEAVKGLPGIESMCTGNAIKYLWRWKRKNGVEDLKKARWYIDRLIGILTA